LQGFSSISHKREIGELQSNRRKILNAQEEAIRLKRRAIWIF